jgi:hypothetical protein
MKLARAFTHANDSSLAIVFVFVIALGIGIGLAVSGCGAPDDGSVARSDTASCGQQGQPCCPETSGDPFEPPGADPFTRCSTHQLAIWPTGVACVAGTCQAWECPTPGLCSGLDAPGCSGSSYPVAVCKQCGFPGSPCCDDNWCDSTSYCRSDGSCQPRCGGYLQTCCPNPLRPQDPPAGCGEGTFCDGDGTCQGCGIEGYACCPGATPCRSGLTCGSDGKCAT